MKLPDPDQDLLEQLDSKERRTEFLTFVPALAWAFVAGLATFGILKLAVHWSGRGALDAAGLIFAVMVFVLRPRAKD